MLTADQENEARFLEPYLRIEAGLITKPEGELVSQLQAIVERHDYYRSIGNAEAAAEVEMLMGLYLNELERREG